MTAFPSRPSDAGQVESLLEFETLIADTSASFFAALSDNLDLTVERALEGVRDFFQVDRCVLMSVSTGQKVVGIRLAAYSAGISNFWPDVDFSRSFPWSHRTLIIERRPVRISRLAELPPEAVTERSSWIELPIRSALTLPIERGGIVRYLMLLNTVHEEREWPDAFVTRLRVLGEMLASALDRQSMFVELRDAEERVKLAVDSAGAALWVLDHRTDTFWTNELARELFGYLPGEVITAERVMESIHPADRELIRDAVERSSREGHAIDAEYRIIRRDGSERWVSSRGRPHFTPEGEPDRLMGASTDITARKVAEQSTRKSEARLACGADLAGLAYYDVDFQIGTMYVDDRLRDICGIPPDREQGLQALQFWMEHLHPDDRTFVMDEREKLQDGRSDRLSVEYRYMHPSRGQRWFHHLAGVNRRDASRRATHTYGVFRDITERREAEEALKRSHAEIERLKDRLQAEGEYLKAEIRLTRDHREIVGQSECMRKVLHLVEQVAPTDSSVLVRGETGSRKELIAQAIHRLSARKDQVMVKVNCAALPSGLVEAELFGREKGAYTGAMTRQAGRFEIADGSTIFLDEIGELPLELQAKLLRVLESGEFERLGSPKTIKVNVRVVAATNRDLAEAIKIGKFREDLFYRLNVFPIRVPPLRERAEDIPLLVWTFIQEFCSRMGKKITQVPRKTMDSLLHHAWPGNVRELRNVIEHAAIITQSDTLKIPLLDDAAPVVASGRTLEDVEREHILRVLEKSGWHIKGPQGAAAELGMNPGTLYSRLKKLNIRTPQQIENDLV